MHNISKFAAVSVQNVVKLMQMLSAFEFCRVKIVLRVWCG